MKRRDFILSGSIATIAAGTLAHSCQPQKQDKVAEIKTTSHKAVIPPSGNQEWRNKQSDMAYRQLGKTGLMVSEIGCGGDTVRQDTLDHVHLMFEKGLNYFDSAPAYGNGKSEKGYGKVIKSVGRENVFLSSKVSEFTRVRADLYREILKGLPEGKRKLYEERAQQMILERGAAKPGYHYKYWTGQRRSMDPSYLCNAMMPDYAHKVEGSPELRKIILESVEGTLKRYGTDYLDILHCPHGANSPEEAENEEIWKVADELKQSGKIRFLGTSSHNDPAGVMRAVNKHGKYDLVMVAYNILNEGFLHQHIVDAYNQGIGVLAMKVAMAVVTQHEELRPLPQWRTDKLNTLVKGDMNPPMKAYLWALQNPHITAIMSNMWNKQHVEENLSVVGKKIELNYG